MLPHPQNQSYTGLQMSRLTKLKEMKEKKVHNRTVTGSSISATNLRNIQQGPAGTHSI